MRKRTQAPQNQKRKLRQGAGKRKQNQQLKKEPPAKARAERKSLFVPHTPLQESLDRTYRLSLWAEHIRKGIARGEYDASSPPPAKALKIVAELSNFNLQKILQILGIDYNTWHAWLGRQKLNP